MTSLSYSATQGGAAAIIRRTFFAPVTAPRRNATILAAVPAANSSLALYRPVGTFEVCTLQNHNVLSDEPLAENFAALAGAEIDRLGWTFDEIWVEWPQRRMVPRYAVAGEHARRGMMCFAKAQGFAVHYMNRDTVASRFGSSKASTPGLQAAVRDALDNGWNYEGGTFNDRESVALALAIAAGVTATPHRAATIH